MSKIVKPYETKESKKVQIQSMFNKIAHRYDFLNHVLTFGLDFYWRKKAVLILREPKKILDVATGTGDFAISSFKYTEASIVGIDIAENMIELGREKVNKKGMGHRIKLKIADSEALPFSDEEYDAVTIGFGVRNFQDLNKGLKEVYRVMKKGSIISILEPTNPKIFPIKQLHNIYFNYVLPYLGGFISKDKDAYSYLSKSVGSFPSDEKFCNELKNVGFKNCRFIPLTFGTVNLYTAIK